MCNSVIHDKVNMDKQKALNENPGVHRVDSEIRHESNLLFPHVTAGLWPHRYHRLQTRGLHSPLGLTLGCETLGLGFVPTNKPKKRAIFH